MSYLHKIGSSISAKSKSIANKAKAASETNSLNNIIKSEQNKIDTNFKMIGKLYFEKFGDNPYEEFADPISSIKDSLEKIRETQEEITKIRNRTRCPNCSEPFKPDAVFCSKCGTRLKEGPPVPQEKICLNCGSKLGEDDIFCDNCGTRYGEVPLEEEQTLTEEVASEPKDNRGQAAEETTAEEIQESEAPSDTTAPEKKICPSCGAEADESIAKFCNQCGTAFN